MCSFIRWDAFSRTFSQCPLLNVTLSLCLNLVLNEMFIVLRVFNTTFNNILVISMEVGFIGGENWNNWRKPST
jgi:hypothetical protein